MELRVKDKISFSGSHFVQTFFQVVQRRLCHEDVEEEKTLPIKKNPELTKSPITRSIIVLPILSCPVPAEYNFKNSLYLLTSSIGNGYKLTVKIEIPISCLQNVQIISILGLMSPP